MQQIFFLAGEPSGDRLGADLMAGLKATKHDFIATGVGGDAMQGEGLSSIFPMNDLAVMGFADVLMRLPLLLWRLWQLKRRILKQQPDVVVLIDSQVFSMLLAGGLRQAGFDRPIILYVAPSVWAWKPERAAKLKPLFNEVLAILPFEPAVMKELDGPKTSYVGHPALHALPEPINQPQQRGRVALLPGSRAGEIRRHLPLFRQVVEKLHNHERIEGFTILTLPHLQAQLQDSVAAWGHQVEVVSDHDARQALLQQAPLAIVTAGTITLELALAGVAMTGTYVPDKRLMQHFVKAGFPMIALPNIIVGERIIPEIIPGPDMEAELVASALVLLDDEKARNKQSQSFAKMRQLMAGKKTPLVNPAARVATYLNSD